MERGKTTTIGLLGGIGCGAVDSANLAAVMPTATHLARYRDHS